MTPSRPRPGTSALPELELPGRLGGADGNAIRTVRAAAAAPRRRIGDHCPRERSVQRYPYDGPAGAATLAATQRISWTVIPGGIDHDRWFRSTTGR